MYRWLTEAADVLRAAGIKVMEEKGWKTRGHDPARYQFEPKFIVWHHDASPKGPSPQVIAWIRDGQPGGLLPPYSHAWVAMDGTWHVIAAGHAFHAGAGGPYHGVPQDAMNRYSFGIETDHTTGETWPAAQLESLRKGTAALLHYLEGQPDPNLLFHKTWAPGRKTDPDGLDLAHERAAVAALMAHPPEVKRPVVHVADVQRGKHNPSVLLVQRALAKTVGLDYSSGPGLFGPRTTAAYAKWQHTLVPAVKETAGVPAIISLTALGARTRLFTVA